MRLASLVLGLPLIFATAACGDDAEGPPPPPPTLVEQASAPGAYAVGFRDLSLTYEAVGGGGERTLPFKIWYPAINGGEGPARYAVGGIVEVSAGDTLAAPAPAPGGPYPVLVYSHGSGGEALLAYPYAERFASHGWVVVSANHTGNTAIDAIMGTSDSFGRILLNRPHDITALLDVTEALEGDLAGVADTGRTFLFGHSFGGYTTLAAAGADLDADAVIASCDDAQQDCSLYQDPDYEAALRAGFGDPRIDAFAPQAPALVPEFAEGQLAALDQPAMLQSGRRDQTTTHESQAVPAWAGLDGADDVWIDIPNGGHLTFISSCYDLDPALVGEFYPTAEIDGCGDDFVPAEKANSDLAAYLLAFANLHVLGETQWEEVLTGPPLNPGFDVVTR